MRPDKNEGAGAWGFYSHIFKTGARHNQRPLEAHLRAVSECAAAFAQGFAAQEWAKTAGLWHDLGKYQSAWQTYLASHHTGDPHDAEPKGSVPHALAGAQHAERELGALGRLLAYVIAGHHAGLPDFHSDDGGMGSLRHRLHEAASNPKRDELTAALANAAHIPADILAKPALRPDARMDSGAKGSELALSLWLRMLFSCLVDADFLDAEAFLNPTQHAQRPVLPKAADLLPAFDGLCCPFHLKAPRLPPPRGCGRIHAAMMVTGRPSWVKRFSTATRVCSSTTCRSNVRAITRSPSRLKQCIFVSAKLRRQSRHGRRGGHTRRRHSHS